MKYIPFILSILVLSSCACKYDNAASAVIYGYGLDSKVHYDCEIELVQPSK